MLCVRVHVCGFFLLPLFDSFNFIYYRCIIDVPRPLRNEILDHSISKDWCVTRKMSQSVRNILGDYWKYSQNIWLKCIHYTSCLNLSSVGKRLKKSLQQVLALRQNRFFLNICDYFKRYVKSTEIQLHISSVR